MRKQVLLMSMLLVLSHQGYGQKEVQKRWQTAMIAAEDGAIIELDKGVFQILGTLSLDGKKRVTIRGKGIGETILDFTGQTSGAEGLRVSDCTEIVLEGFTIRNAKGDCLKAMNVDGLKLFKVKTEWAGPPKKENGAYGIYPVLCKHVVIDACEAVGASDAGIYVGQSQFVEVKNCKAWNNVAGIEIENTLDASVHHCETFRNTGGVLVFDLPDLVQKQGGRVRVYENYIHDNNFKNFAPKGNIVAKVPQGSGVIILATRDVQLYNNRIINNNSISCGIISYYMTEIPIKDSLYYPYPDKIVIKDNTFERERVRFQGKGRFGQLFKYKLRFGKSVPHIIYDGIDDDSGKRAIPILCISGNTNLSFAELDADNGFKKMERDPKKYSCGQ